MKQVIAGLLLLVMAGRYPAVCLAQAQEQSTAQQVGRIPLGTFVEVRFTDRTKARGYLTQVGSDAFSLNPTKAGTGVSREAAFKDVDSVKAVKPTHTPIAAWIATGVIAAVVVIVVAVVLIERHNE